MPSVINASFPAMMCCSDGLPIVVGFSESDHRITDLQVNVPPYKIFKHMDGKSWP